MAQATIAADLHQASNIAVNITAEVAFDLILRVDNLAELSDFSLGQVLHSSARVNPGLLDDGSTIHPTDPVNERKGVQNRFFAW